MISTKEMKILEENSEYFGVSKLDLMENAGKNCADYIKTHFPGKSVLVVAGQGNNGGDGFVIARHLNCKIYFLGEESKLKHEAQVNFRKINKSQFVNDVIETHIIVDCIFGAGFSLIGGLFVNVGKQGIPEPYFSVIKKINKIKAYRISIDIPSGLDADTGKWIGKADGFVKANLVLTLHDIKQGLNKSKTKFNTKIIPVGIPEKAITCVGPGDIKAVIHERKPEAHKGDFGRVLLIASSEEYAGASVLVTRAVVNSLVALRAGTDLVTVAAPEKVGWLIHKYLPDIIVKKFHCSFFEEQHADEILKIALNHNVVVIGPGLGRQSDNFVKKFVKLAMKHKAYADKKHSAFPNLVIDADALKAIKINDVKGAILTPHSTEFELLTGKKLPAELDKKIEVVRKCANNNIIILKGNPDIIAYKNKVKLNYTGNPAMTVGGTGDVLAGLCAGLIAQSKHFEDDKSKQIAYDQLGSAYAAAFVNGMAGDNIAEVVGYGLIASDLLMEVARVIKKYRR